MSGYGAVDTNEPMDAEAQPFNESDFLYLKEQKLTREEKFKKIILTTIPILVAFFIMGGIAYWLFKDFDHLYPGPSGKKYPSKYSPQVSPIHTPTAPAPAPKVSPSSSSTSSSSGGGNSACTANPDCKKLGLTGDCCPTSEGILLGCCS